MCQGYIITLVTVVNSDLWKKGGKYDEDKIYRLVGRTRHVPEGDPRHQEKHIDVDVSPDGAGIVGWICL
jgi:hypothetical protein